MENFRKFSRSEMKNVIGGDGTCAFSCNGFYSTQTYSKSDAIANANENVTSGRCTSSTWCCTSCPQR